MRVDVTDDVPERLRERVPAGISVCAPPLSKSASPPYGIRLERDPSPMIYVETDTFRRLARGDGAPRPIEDEGPATVEVLGRTNGCASLLRLAEGDRSATYRVLEGSLDEGWLLSWPD